MPCERIRRLRWSEDPKLLALLRGETVEIEGHGRMTFKGYVAHLVGHGRTDLVPAVSRFGIGRRVAVTPAIRPGAAFNVIRPVRQRLEIEAPKANPLHDFIMNAEAHDPEEQQR